MKRLCNNKTVEEQLKACKAILALILVSIVLLVGVMIYDFAMGEGVDSSRIAILCADVCIMSLNIKNMRDLKNNADNE